MPVDLIKIQKDKDNIISFIQSKGPSLPIHIAKASNMNMLFTSAFLSELYAEGRLKMSSLKVGSSSLYYIAGQEEQLQKAAEHLNQKEKEAFNLLKKDKILFDEKQQPAIRVALRSIKDFAIPLKIKIDEKQDIIWKWFLINDAELDIILQKQVANSDSNTKKETPSSISQKKSLPENTSVQEGNNSENSIIEKDKKKDKKKTKTDQPEFILQVKEFLSKKDIELISIFIEKKKEMLAIARANGLFGKQEYYIIAKDKKRISEEEIDLALEKTQSEKMPVIIFAPGELDKKASIRILALRNLIKFINPIF